MTEIMIKITVTNETEITNNYENEAELKECLAVELEELLGNMGFETATYKMEVK